MKIAILLDVPFAENIRYPKRVYYEAKSLAESGYNVTLYCKNEQDTNLPKFEIKNGIKIRRTFDYFLGTTTLVDKYLTAHVDLLNSVDEKYDVYHCHDVNTWPVGYLLSKRDNAKFICETHEFFPDYICEEWHTDLFKYEITKMLVKTRGDYIRFSDKVIAVSEDTAIELKKIFTLREMPTVIYNTRPKKFIDYAENNQFELTNYLRNMYNIDNKTNILLFHGLVGAVIGVDVMIKIMKHLKDCVFIVVGEGRGSYIDDLRKLVCENKIEKKVIFTGFKPSDELFKYSTYADFLIYLGRNQVKNMDLTIPNKFFDYVMAGKPIISSNLQAVSKIINKYKIGITLNIENNSIEELAREIQLYITNKKLVSLANENIKKIQENYVWEKQEKKLLALYESLK